MPKPSDLAFQRAREEQEKSPVEQAFGLEGGLKRNLLLLALWLAGGTLFYYLQGFEELESHSPIASFYYAVQAGLSIGFGVLTPRCEESMIFTIGFLLLGAAVCAEFLSAFVTDTISSLEKGRLGLVVTDSQEPLSRLLLLLGSWWTLGALFGHYHEGWSWTRSLFFAVSATSTAGMQGLDSTDDASLLFCAVYSLVGVPLYAGAIGRLSFSIAEKVMYRRREQIRQRAVTLMEACNEECSVEVFDMHDSSGSGHLSAHDLESLIKFLANSRGMVVTDKDIAYFLSEFDSDGDCSVGREEFLKGMERWTREVEQRQQRLM